MADTIRANGMDELDAVPATLAEAHEVIRRQRPKMSANPLVWVAFHRSNAEIYAEVSTVDGAHKYEAQACAGEEIRRAREIEDGLAESN